MFIVNQDLDLVDTYKGELHTVPVAYQGQILGVNLYTGNFFLGTFDNSAEAILEMRRIMQCEDLYYTVSGYSGVMWIDWLILVQLWEEDLCEVVS